MKVMRKPTLRDNNNAVSPVLGAVLMIFLTFVLAVATVAAVYNDDAVERINNAFTKTPTAVIEIEGVVGVIPNPPNPGGYDDNYIRLVHKSGDSLALDSTLIILSGEGSSHIGIVPNSTKVEGNVIIRYVDLTTSGKTTSGKFPTYKKRNPSLDDNLWSTGEQLILRGDDSIDGSDASTVLVSVNGITDTRNNYGFKSDTTVTIKIFDKTTQRIIAEGTAIVKPAE